MPDGLRRMLDLLDARQRRQLVLVMALMLAMGLMDLAGVASILPFLAVAANPEAIESQAWMRRLYEAMGYETPAAFLRLLGLLVLALVLTGIAMRALTFYMVTRFTRRTVFNLAGALLSHYLTKPYDWFLGRHSADLGKTILAEAQQVVGNTIGPTMRLVANGTVVAILVAFLVWLEPVITLVTVALMGGTFGAIYMALRARLLSIGEDRKQAMNERFHVVQEAMTGIKEVKLLGLERSYVDRFADPSWRLSRHQASLALVGEMPRYALEAVAFGGMLLFVVWLMWSADGDLQAVLPLIGAFAFAGLKLMPTMQAVFRDVAMIRYGKPVLDQVHGELDLYDTPIGRRALPSAPQRDAAPLGLQREIRLSAVRYRYPGAARDSLDGVTVTIPARSSVGIVGSSGAGKTTFVDIVLGLLRPDAGALEVDGRAIGDAELPAWQRTVGYVPQSIYLVDDTIAGNIAFGVPAAEIDRDRVRRAGALARLDEFVGRLPDGYDTRIGEAGVRLSGGQRQRIGIARALYRDPEVIVFDEAMSALDTVTERAVMDAVNTLHGQKTLVIITHRLSSIVGCDRIVLLSDGRVEMEGDYYALRETSAGFRALSQAAAE